MRREKKKKPELSCSPHRLLEQKLSSGLKQARKKKNTLQPYLSFQATYQALQPEL